MNNPFNSSDTCRKSRLEAPVLAVMTESVQSGKTPLFRRKNSRIRRFKRFRCTAEPIFLPTDMPNLLWGKWLGQMET